MTARANLAYDRQGFRTTKALVEAVRRTYGRTMPHSLGGEPASLRADADADRPYAGRMPATTSQKR